jgi:crotonobetainyl-CoA:carnitine CoA-transferase CaiB-like acyl-CoA transferase
MKARRWVRSSRLRNRLEITSRFSRNLLSSPLLGAKLAGGPHERLCDIVVPLEGAGGKLTSTVSSPIQVHGVTKVPAKRAPELGEHNEEILRELGFEPQQIASFLTNGAAIT